MTDKPVPANSAKHTAEVIDISALHRDTLAAEFPAVYGDDAARSKAAKEALIEGFLEGLRS